MHVLSESWSTLIQTAMFIALANGASAAQNQARPVVDRRTIPSHATCEATLKLHQTCMPSRAARTVSADVLFAMADSSAVCCVVAPDTGGDISVGEQLHIPCCACMSCWKSNADLHAHL